MPEPRNYNLLEDLTLGELGRLVELFKKNKFTLHDVISDWPEIRTIWIKIGKAWKKHTGRELV